jgi:hypothetical protein
MPGMKVDGGTSPGGTAAEALTRVTDDEKEPTAWT